MTHAMCVWDFTCHDMDLKVDDLKKILTKDCKKWAFQLEKGEKSGKLHYQGRISLKVKKRRGNIPKRLGHLSITSNENKDNDFYVMKDESRVEGPWTDKDEVIYIPRQIREIEKLRPFQQSIIDKLSIWDTRWINVVYCPVGNKGKSILITYCNVHKLAKKIPPIDDVKEMMGLICCIGAKRAYMIDMPKAMDKYRLRKFYTAMETLKDGYVYDTRYKFKEISFDCPNIWIFTNELPDDGFMSADRWKYWKIIEGELEVFKADRSIL